jgi:hypothetical protein
MDLTAVSHFEYVYLIKQVQTEISHASTDISELICCGNLFIDNVYLIIQQGYFPLDF